MTEHNNIYHIYPPKGSLDLLSQVESDLLRKRSDGELYHLFRNCLLAVLNTGSQTDNANEIFQKYENFDAKVERTERGIKLELYNPPQSVFVDGELTHLIRTNLFSVLRDILYMREVVNSYDQKKFFKYGNQKITTDIIFMTLRNAKALKASNDSNVMVCWGGHSINDIEYQYAREVGHELGLRHFDICTGCGPGAMEAPMRGAAVGHTQQGHEANRYIGITEPSIIAAEPPNPLVNELIIMPDIEKRIEAFIRLGHGLIIFPGGVGTAEEFLYVLSILMMKENQDQVLPIILTGPTESRAYFETLDRFIHESLGSEAQKYYQIIIGDATLVAQKMKEMMPIVRENRKARDDAYCFNWSLAIAPELQKTFDPTHENMANLNLHKDQPKEKLAAALRQAFSGIVAGNIKEVGIKAIAEHGPYELHGAPELMDLIDQLLNDFVAQGRMKLPGEQYEPCYRVIK
ncbi:nucleotide 5'-monophosphate nucleosidase PpnN [Wohlfahrtiimonas chitiniclastica]|uniref:nucleotide 5'-monophosphate nucleosidase PpnN n=1 Tax=Wohlfahrtiimonas chitiniclastica TaxID=400946 RepID=UPI0007B41DB3|nr:nucleotide 5'-monophosphate nucleosidase PpnN [Wohlfahrtiimonas chitiniclastica]KZS22318.1 hypothetical protein BMY_0138 [Wohlfahrtiimonas chitiniclastica]MBS7814074.1 DUF3412 domain-containing protein [Wohlfahrtiimonas chitiniclastica]MBS7835340.1 DUF3412 domain-containing protein [Wohlfahrtiimonas chitiniclastica]MDC7251554.1 LOG family protein [Wohlfahrtiimonas chitiniclastica]OYQ76490.1 LOG family protein [Wohlfahrtiimonas chitiniclastica]